MNEHARTASAGSRPKRSASLFGDRRDGRGPAGNSESSFGFLDRVDQPYWERVRRQLDKWFGALPPGQEAEDLRSRFRKQDETQHLAAWWELYLHRFLTRVGDRVEIHPVLSDTNDRPDFRVHHTSGTFLVEAATTFSGVEDHREHSRLEGQVLDALEKATSTTFTIGVEFATVGTNMPRIVEITRPLDEWLSTLDPDANYTVESLPTRVFEIRGWQLDIVAFPIDAEHRGKPGRLIATGPMVAGTVNDVERLRATLDRKRKKYGATAEPLMIAVLLPSTFADLQTVEKALYGETALEYQIGTRGNERWVRIPNGIWRGPAGPRARHVSGLITGFGIQPGAAAATTWPRVWPNPWATRPLDVQLPLPYSVGTKDAQFHHDAWDAREPRDLLGIDDQWPGPEPPFIT